MQSRYINDSHASATHRDDTFLVQATEAAAHRFQRQAEVARDLVTAHRQVEFITGLADTPIALTQILQEQGNALASLAARQHIQMILVAITALAHHAKQLHLQARQLRGNTGKISERQFADARIPKRDGFAAVITSANGIQPEQFTRQMEAEHMFITRFADTDCLECPFAGDEHRLQYVADTEQPITRLQRSTALDYGFKLFQVITLDASRQAQLLQ